MGELEDNLRSRWQRLHRVVPSGHVQGLGTHHERRYRFQRSENRRIEIRTPFLAVEVFRDFCCQVLE
jgi:hypothetical protein